jgi:hypothetical protein
MAGDNAQMAAAKSLRRLYGFCFAESTAPRTMRELPGMITTAIASMACVVLGVNTETIAKARIRAGIAMRASMTR